MSDQNVLIRIHPTPNPNAWKFVLDRPVVLEGKASFLKSEGLPENVRLASDLLSLEGVRQVHFYENVITITAQFDIDPDELQQNAVAIIQTRWAVHDPSFNKSVMVKKSRDHLTEDLKKIEEILDRTVRPGLQGDGGDMDIESYEGNKLYIRYQGACGTCPSSTTGTLMAIESILRDEFNPEIQVIPT